MNIISMTKKLRTRLSAKISQIMNEQGIDISSVIVRRRLNEQGLFKLQLLAKSLLSDDHRDNRLEWAKANKNTDWSKVIFTDKTTFSQFNKPRKVWRQKGEIIKAPTVKHSGKVHVYGCFQKKAFEKFITSQRILMLIYYILSMRLLYYFLLEFFLERIIIVRNYKKIIILNIHLEKLKNERRIIILREFLGYHRV